MAKEHKATQVEATDSPDVTVDSPVEVTPAAAAKAAFSARLHPKKARFEVLGGTYWAGDTPHQKGEVIESDDDLPAIYGNNMFRKVE